MEKYTQILDEVRDPLTVPKFVEMSSLSRSEAISMLEKYIKSKGEPVWALYEVSGVVDSSEYSFLPAGDTMMKHVVVPESALDEAKSKFSEVISTRLHSIQRTNPKGTRVYGRSWADNDDLKGKTLPQQEKSRAARDSSTVEVKKEKSAEPEQKPSNSSVTKPTADTKKIVPLKKQANLSMFTKKSEKKAEKEEKSVSPPPPEQEKKIRKRPKVEVDEPEAEELKMIVEKKEKTPEKKRQNTISDSPISDGYPSSREQSVEKETSPPAKRKKSGVNDENKKLKKRLIVPDSDEEESPEPMEVDKKIKEGEVVPNKPEDRRRTKRIEKIVETYVDEDGYLVSKEVQKTVECSPQKESPEKPKAKVITAAVPGAAKVPKKNSTITSFFKKV